MQGQRWHLPKGYKVVAVGPEDGPADSASTSSETQQLPIAHRRSKTQTSLMKEADEDGSPIIQPPDNASQRYYRMYTSPRRKPLPTRVATEDWN